MLVFDKIKKLTLVFALLVMNINMYKLMNKSPKQLHEIRKFLRPHSIRGVTMHGQFTSYTRIIFIYTHTPTHPLLFTNILTNQN
jgi:hypothetical protein